MELSWISIALTAAVAVLGWLYVRARGGNIKDVPAGLDEIKEQVRTWVEAAEQMYNSGQFPEGTDPGAAKAAWVMENAKKYLPGVSEDLIKAFLEQAVFWLKQSPLGKG